MGDINLGTQVFGCDGKAHDVLAIFPQGIKPVYRVAFNDGTSTLAGMEHLWTVRDANRRRKGKGWAVMSTAEILEKGLTYKSNPKREQSGRKPILKWEVPVCKAVEYPEKQFFIHPYILGVLIGDGCLTGKAVEFVNSDADGDIHKRIEKLLADEYRLYENRYGTCPRYKITHGSTTKNAYRKALEEYGLCQPSEHKFIPSQYKLASVEQRKELLAGLMDTDGSVQKGAKMSYSTISKQLAEDVRILVLSLGGLASVHEYHRESEGKPTEYRVSMKVPFNPFFTARKREAVRIRKSNYISRYIESVTYERDEECQCIMVDSDEHTYLTDEYLVTHNTLQSIGIVNEAGAFPCLVICPSSLKINWQREFEKFTDHRAMVLNDACKATWPYHLQMGIFDVAVVNYESLRKFFVYDIKSQDKTFKLRDVVFNPAIRIFKSVIIDESHRVKDPGTQQTILTKGLTIGKEYIILLSGTPVVNKPSDLIAQLAIMDRLQEFGGRGKFLAEYEVDGKNLGDLQEKLYGTCLIRREKAKVLTQLPDKTRCDLVVGISNRKEYDTAYNDLKKYLEEYTECTDQEIRRKMRMQALVKFMTLRSLSAIGKVAQAKEFITNFTDGGGKMVVFCSLHEIVDELCRTYPDAVRVTGRDSIQAKQMAVDRFQNDPECKLIVCSIKAAGVGLTLTASSTVCFIEFPWTYADCCQCEDRTHRIGQKDNVTCYYLLGEDTIDPRLYGIIQDKRSTANQIMGGDDNIPTDERYFDELMATLK